MVNELHCTPHTVYKWEQRLYDSILHNTNYLRIDILIISCDVGVIVQKCMGVTTELSAKH